MKSPARQPASPASLALALRQALHRRQALLVDAATTCCRLVDDRRDGLPGVVVERFGPVVVVQDRPPAGQPSTIDPRSIAQQLGELLSPHGISAVYVKPFVPDRSHQADDKHGPLYDPAPAWGEASPPQVVVREHGLELLVRPYDGWSVGLFLDQRENRRVWRAECAGQRVLNTFCYTGAFSVAALAGRARRVVSVDISKKYLAWADENISLLRRTGGLGCEPESFRIPTQDFFRAARKRNEQYDRIMLDPPSFARDAKGRAFSAEADYADLITDAWAVLAPGGQLWACTNHTRISAEQFVRMARRALAGERFALLDVPPVPIDFRPDAGGSPIRTLRLERKP